MRKAQFHNILLVSRPQQDWYVSFTLELGPLKNNSILPEMGGDAAPLDPKETIPILVKFIASTTSKHSGKSWDYVGEGINEYGW